VKHRRINGHSKAVGEFGIAGIKEFGYFIVETIGVVGGDSQMCKIDLSAAACINNTVIFRKRFVLPKGTRFGDIIERISSGPCFWAITGAAAKDYDR
jgi:hypothetical protein